MALFLIGAAQLQHIAGHHDHSIFVTFGLGNQYFAGFKMNILV